MNYLGRILLAAILFSISILLANGQQFAAPDSAKPTEQRQPSKTIALPNGSDEDGKARPKNSAAAAEKSSLSETPPSSVNPVNVDTAVFGTMLQVLLARGLINSEEARAIASSGNVVAQRDRLASTLLQRGVITATDYAAIVGSNRTKADSARASDEQTPPSQRPSEPGPQQMNRPTLPSVIPAVAPSRPLQLEATKRGSIIPDIKVGDIRLKFNGFMKASVIYDSYNPAGSDFPSGPFLVSDTGPNTAGEFRVKARSFRIGGTFEGLDPSPKTSVLGRFEFDFEGNYQVGGSSIRNPNLRLRLAFVRIDHRYSENTSAFAVFGQDWTPFGSSTLPNTIETVGLGSGWGNPYDRLPQVRVGLDHNFGGARQFHLGPEFAIVLPKYGITPLLSGAPDLATQLNIGEREGTDSRRPEVQGRVVAQFILDGAPNVRPAQLVMSFMQGERRSIVTAANIPTPFKSAFPNGAEVTSDRYGFTLEGSLPTRFVTVSMKYYNGDDLASFNNVGQGLTIFNDTAGLTGIVNGTAIDGRSVLFGLLNGRPVIAPQRSVRARGGFIELGFPLSRIFDADPQGRWAGFDVNFHYGYDEALARDARHAGSNRGKSDWMFGNVRYKFNNFITFAFEQGYYRTRAVNNSILDFGGLPLLRGIPSRSAHDNRSEFATIFNF